jgi:hypothetical protein
VPIALDTASIGALSPSNTVLIDASATVESIVAGNE